MTDDRRPAEDETTEHPTVSGWPAPQQPGGTAPQKQQASAPAPGQTWMPPANPTTAPAPHAAWPPANQAWGAAPTQQTWQSGAQPGWPPPYGWPSGQGWAQPPQSWSPAHGWRPYSQQPPAYGSSTLATVGAVGLLVAGGLLTLVGLLLVILGAAGSAFLAEVDPSYGEFGAAAAGVVITLAVVVLVLGILEIATAIGVFVHRTWSRWMGIVLGVLGVLLGFFMLMLAFEPPSDSGFAIVSALWLAAHGFAVAALAVGGEHFEQRPYGG